MVTKDFRDVDGSSTRVCQTCMTCASLDGVSAKSKIETVVDIPFHLRFRGFEEDPSGPRFDMARRSGDETLTVTSQNL